MDVKMMADRFDDAAGNLGRIGEKFSTIPQAIKSQAHEIRIRTGRPVMISLPDTDIFLTQNGSVSYSFRPGLLYADKMDVEESFRILCNSSVHSHQNEIKNGFVILKGGHRAGICGTAVVENEKVVNIKDISSINLRIAREIRSAADETIRAIVSGGVVNGALIFGPPGCGKTTVLRDLARQLSLGEKTEKRIRVAVVDERGELAATFLGQPQNELGPCCDVLDGYPKGEGILQAVRCLAPDVIICDEIGSESDAKAIAASLNAGVTVIASAHAGSLEELKTRQHIISIIASGAFKKMVLLKGRDNPGKVDVVYDNITEAKQNI